jgi:tetratricopeptide (TPR) repeat protein
VPSQDSQFPNLDRLFASLGYEMDRGEPELGNAVTPEQVRSAAPPPSSPPPDDAGVPDEPAEVKEPESDPAEMLIEAMLSDSFDSPGMGGGDSGDGGGDFLDLSGGSSSESADPYASGASGGSPSVEEYTQSKLADAPQWEDPPAETASLGPALEPEPDPALGADAAFEPEPDPALGADAAFAPEADLVSEPESDFAFDPDSVLTPESEFASDPGPEGVPDFSEGAPAGDDFGADFAQELEGVGFDDLGDGGAAMGDLPGAADLGPDGEMLPEYEGVPDGLSSDIAADGEMDSFAEELEAMDLPGAGPSASGDFDLGDSFSEGAGPAEGDFAAADPGGMDSFSGLGEADAGFSAASEDGEGSHAFDDVDLGFGAGVAIPADKEKDDYSEEAIELDDDDLQRIRKRMMIMTPSLRELATRAISEDIIKPAAQNRLIRMLLNKAPLEEVRIFLENETGESAVDDTALPEGEDAFGGYGAPESGAQRYGGGVLSNVWPMLRIGVLICGVVALGLLLYLLLLRPGMTGSGLMQRGLVAIGNEEYITGENYFRRGEAYLGKNITWYRRYADAYREMGEHGRAIRKIREGLDFAPADFDSLLLLGDIHTEIRDFDAARETFRQMERLFPRSLRVPERMGDVYIAMGDAERDDRRSHDYYERARLEYQKITDREWKNLDGQFKSLLAYVKLRRLPQAEEKYSQILRINRNAMHAPILTEYAGLLQDNDKWFDSRVVLGRVLDRHWQFAPAHYRVGKYFRHQLDFGRALISLNNAVRLDNNNAVYHNELGEILLSSPRPDIPAAMQSFTRAREINPEYPTPYINLGHIFYEYLTPGDSGDINLEERHYDQALENYENALRRMPADFNDERFFYNLGWLHYRRGRHEDAVTAWQRIYIENPFHPVVSFSMGNAWLHLGRDELAEAEFEKVIRYYETIAARIPEIDPALRRHKNVFGKLVNSYNNLGVAWARRYERLRDPEWERKALMSFWRARELSDRLNRAGFEFPENNIKYILHREYRNRGLAIAPELRGDGSRSGDTIPKFLTYERQ